MNPDGKGSWPFRLGSIQPLTYLASRCQRQGGENTDEGNAWGRGSMWNPSTLRFLPLCLLWGCQCGGPGETFWLLDLGCSTPFLFAFSWLRPLEGLWCPVLHSAWN